MFPCKKGGGPPELKIGDRNLLPFSLNLEEQSLAKYAKYVKYAKRKIHKHRCDRLLFVCITQSSTP